MAEQNGKNADTDTNDETADVEESGAGYGNHGDAQGDTSDAGQPGQAGVSGGMNDNDRG